MAASAPELIPEDDRATCTPVLTVLPGCEDDVISPLPECENEIITPPPGFREGAIT